jgi:hypothetical protein
MTAPPSHAIPYRSLVLIYCVIASHAGVIAPLVAGLRFGGAPAALELVAQEWGGAFGVAMQGLDDVMDLIGDPMNTGKDSFQDFR